ncbi:MAG: PAS domain-containing protein [Magnetococcales bacterium]|nr:PAS domain-containing protein [Magnetococcales bacterium]
MNAPRAEGYDLILRRQWPWFLFLAAGLAMLARRNFLLFHTLVELFVVLVGVLMAVVVWNTRVLTRNHFFTYLASGNFWIALIELVHMLAYKGMPTLAGASGLLASQLWILARYGEALLLLTAPWFLVRPCGPRMNLLFGLLTLLGLTTIFSDLFPVTFVEGMGVTLFKSLSELIIMAILGVSVGILHRMRHLLDVRLFTLLVGSILLSILAGAAFTFYIDVYGISNMVGHLAKLASVWLLFEAVVLTMLREPFRALARGASSFDAIPDPVVLLDARGIVRQANCAAVALARRLDLEWTGASSHALLHPQLEKQTGCPICHHIAAGAPLPVSEFFLPHNKEWWEITLTRVQADDPTQGMIQMARNITRRKEDEARLRATEEHTRWLASLFSMSADLTAILDDSMTFLAANKSYQDHFAPTGELVEGRTLWEVHGTKWYDQVLRPHMERALAGETVRFQTCHPSRMGSLWVDMIYQPILGARGKVNYIIKQGRNITQLKKTENDLAEAERFNRRVLATLGEGVIVLDRDLRYQLWNEFMYHVSGKTAQEVLGRHPDEIFPFLRPAGIMACMERALAGEEVITGAIRVEAPPPFPSNWISAHFSPLRSADGTIQGVVGFIQDISERVGNEESLRQSQALLDSIVEHVPAMIFLKEARDLTFVLFNRTGERLLGYDRAELLGKSVEDLFPPDQAKFYTTKDRETLSSHAVVEIPEEPIRTRAGEERSIRTFKTGLYDAQGNATHLLGISVDITDMKRSEEEKQRLQEQALRSAQLATLGILSAGIAHEINNPNNAIAVNANLLQGVWRDAQIILEEYQAEHGDFSLGGLPCAEMMREAPRLLTSLTENSRRIKATIDNMKHLARKEDDQAMQRLDPREVIQRSRSILQHTIAKRTRHFHLDLATERLMIRGNPRQLEQVFLNLLMNALQSLPDEQHGVTLSMRQATGRVIVEIADQGQGMTPEVLARVGEPFFTTRTCEGGLGLGVAIIRQILDRHHATLTYTSQPGEGTRATLAFTAMEEEEEDAS